MGFVQNVAGQVANWQAANTAKFRTVEAEAAVIEQEAVTVETRGRIKLAGAVVAAVLVLAVAALALLKKWV